MSQPPGGDADVGVLEPYEGFEAPDALLRIGPYVGELAPGYGAADLLEQLAELPALLASSGARLVAGGRNRHVCIDLPVNGKRHSVIVKAFGTQPWLKDLRDRSRGSKAHRTWVAARHLSRRGVGTPPAIGYLERWEGSRLRESYFLAVYQHGVESFRDALLRLYHGTPPESAHFIALLECVAAGTRAMHDAGFVHNDLGNQNLLLHPDGPGRWRDLKVIDLNRGRIRGRLSLRERGRDLSRINLPSRLLELFVQMYWGDEPPPAALVRWQRLYRRLYGLRRRSRRWRHPVREARLRQRAARGEAGRSYPALRDVWIWDERSGQAIAGILREDRRRLYPLSRYAGVLAGTLRAGPPVRREYRPLIEAAFREPVALAGRIGMAVNPSPATLERELELLGGLGRIPAFVRFYHHEGQTQRRFRGELVHALRRAGHAVGIALVQDRRAVLDPAAWHDFVGEVLDQVGHVVDEVEVGHNINRTKWGLWDFRELRALYAPFAELHRRFPAVGFMGPAAIDFEYGFVLAALREWPQTVPLAALSHHLYVDRRGAPENGQGRFSSLEKFALARAMARAAPACADRVIVSEVGWPVAGTGAYSPIRAPYVAPWRQGKDTGVSEDDYGHFLLRYLCLAICSGLIDKVYWWRLVARGFGLVDDTDPRAWRARPAYALLQRFISVLGESTFIGASLPGRSGDRHGEYRFAFRRPDGETVVLAYAHGSALPFPDLECAHVEDAFGHRLARSPAQLTGQPVYLRASAGLAR